MLKLRNTTNQEIVLQDILFREAGTASDTHEIPEVDRVLWANDDSVLQNISNGNVVLSLNDIDITSINDAINTLKSDLAKDVTITQIDSTSNSITVTSKLGPDGTHKQIIAPEIDMQGWVHEKDADGNDLNNITFEFYKSDGAGGFTSQASADSDTIRTIAHWEPSYTYYVVSGTAELLDTLGVGEEIYFNIQGLRGNLVGADVYNFIQGGIKMRSERVFGLISESSREMPYIEMDLGNGLESVHTNRLSFIFDYTAGINPKVQMLITRMVDPGN